MLHNYKVWLNELEKNGQGGRRQKQFYKQSKNVFKEEGWITCSTSIKEKENIISNCFDFGDCRQRGDIY